MTKSNINNIPKISEPYTITTTGSITSKDCDNWDWFKNNGWSTTTAMIPTKSEHGFKKIEISLAKNGIIVKTSEVHPKNYKPYQDFVFKDFEAFEKWIDDNLSLPLEQTEFIENI